MDQILDIERNKLVNRSKMIGAFTICGLPAMLIAGMVFDSPGSEDYIGVWAEFFILFSFSPICILSVIFSWLLFKCGLKQISIKTVLFPLSIVLFVAVSVLYFFARDFIFPRLNG